MTGLEKIISKIKDESQAKVAQINQDAQAKADKLLSEAEEIAKNHASDINAKAESEAEDIKQRAKSTADLKKRQQILATKQELISNTIAQAKEEICQLSDKEYFDLLLALLKKNIHSGNVKVQLSKKDLDRLPVDFSDNMKNIAKDKGADLEIDNSPINIDGGFILVYDKVEENCSVEALFNNNYELLQDKVHSILFE